MHKPVDKLQHSFLDFNQPMGLRLNPENRWVKMADRIPWDEFEIKYASLFPSDTGNVAKPLRMALGALTIQTKFHYADRELVEQITEPMKACSRAFLGTAVDYFLPVMRWPMIPLPYPLIPGTRMRPDMDLTKPMTG